MNPAAVGPGDPTIPGAADAAPPLPLDQADRVTVHSANRAEVEQAYAAHEEAGMRFRSLRAAWEQHQDQYPDSERATPCTHTDGSWSSGETRRLTPEQNTEATKACADIHDEGERVILPAMRQIEAADPNRGLRGVEHILKGSGSPQGEGRRCPPGGITSVLRARGIG